MKTPTSAYPLTWPEGWRRTPAHQRERARFAKARPVYGTRRNERGFDEQYLRYNARDRLTVAGGRDRVLLELERMGAIVETVVISTNMPVRLDGLPMSGRRGPDDPGVAVYWVRRGQPRCMAVDRYDTVADNLAAIAATLEALRAEVARLSGPREPPHCPTCGCGLPAPTTAP